MIVFLIPLFLLSSNIYAEDLSLSTICSPQEQEAIGLERLSPQQRVAFERWITSWTERVLSQAPSYHQSQSVAEWVSKWPQHLLPKPIPKEQAAAERQAANQSIYRNNSGNSLELNDGSLWQIHQIDTTIARWWRRGDMIDVRSSKADITRPYLLFNRVNNQFVGAKLLRRPNKTGKRAPDDPRLFKNTIAIADIEREGRRIILKDGSMWDISPIFQLEVMNTWFVGDRVRIEKSSDTVYRYNIINVDSGGSVLGIKA